MRFLFVVAMLAQVAVAVFLPEPARSQQAREELDPSESRVRIGSTSLYVRMIGDLDFYLGSVLKNHFGHAETSGTSWDRFIQKTKIDLLSRRHGGFVYTLLQERHKIEHNQAQIDRVFLERMAKCNIQHAYTEGDGIQKSHIDVLLAQQAIREFAEDVDLEVSKLLGAQGGG